MPGGNLIDYEQITFCIMNWIKKVFKGCAHKSSEGHYHGHYAEDRQFYAPSGSGDAWREHENEEIDRAIALSLLEESQKGRRVKDDKSQLEDDEQLARAIQESLNFEPPPQYENVNTYQPMPVHFPTGYRICAGCNTEIGCGRFLNCLSAFWHPECFRCHACNLPISDYEFSMSGNYRFHKSCYKEQYHPKCDVCNHFISTNPAGLIEYRAHPFWMQKYCPSHEHDGTPRCCSCERMEGHYHMPETRGLCLSEEQTVSTIRRRPRLGTGNRSMDMITEPYKLTRRCDVTAILILYGLPRLLTGSILAHEMMHAWMRLQGFRTLSQDVEEGICQVLAHMWLLTQFDSASDSNGAWTSSSSSSSRLKKGKRSQLERKLGEFFKHQIESDASPVYGDGFRAGHQAVYKYGLRNTLEHIRMTGRFPH
ncbi:hypothetical protein ES288_D05G217500v1 [Gossypium darwinii]|uniref:LIM zinc-binding domain-containing protein n=2 Tax=Gossypium darwinii TaxID=34276 RepID=A0A5D2CKQ8_GOSDA|nr:hypothetical protein ES288_D05G217500v1 [Gossypium darwinii]